MTDNILLYAQVKLGGGGVIPYWFIFAVLLSDHYVCRVFIYEPYLFTSLTCPQAKQVGVLIFTLVLVTLTQGL